MIQHMIMVLTQTLWSESVQRHVLDSVEVDEGCGDHEDVEYLMRLEPEIKLSREESLWYSSSVESSS